MTYYKDECEYCKNQVVMNIDELNNPTFFGQPEIQKDESMYKCPVCGHVNVRKNIDLTPCYQNGENNIIFELTNEESEKARAFIKEHKHTILNRPGLPHFKHMDQFTYMITPNGLGGQRMNIKCNECGEGKEIC